MRSQFTVYAPAGSYNIAGQVTIANSIAQSASAPVTLGPAGSPWACTFRLAGSATCAMTPGSSGQTPLPDDDGVAAGVEDAGAFSGDGNRDGTLDSAQANVASVPAGTGIGYVTLVAPAGTSIQGVTATDSRGLPPPPVGVTLPTGVLSFSVLGLPVGGQIDVRILTAEPRDPVPNSYYKLHVLTWVALPSNAVTFDRDSMTLHLVDGGVGDQDGVANGAIVDPGAPAVDVHQPSTDPDAHLPGGGYVALTPARLLDTRKDAGLSTIDGRHLGAGLQPAGAVVELAVTGRAGVPVDATAAVLNIAVTGTTAPGFITVYPCGSPRPTAANLNYAADQTIPNGVIAKIGTDGKVCIYTYAATHLVADIGGYFPADSEYTALSPTRLLETRTDPNLTTVDGEQRGIGIRAGGQVTEVQVGDRGAPTNATAVALNIAVTGATSAGFITVYPCGTSRPTAASLTYDVGETIANNVVAAVGTGGKVCLYTYGATHLIVDLVGYIPAASRYTALSPARLLETRTDAGLSTVDGQHLGAGLRPAGSVVELQVGGRADVPADAAAAVLNIAVTGATAPGFVTVYPCGSERPAAANLNFASGQTISNGVIAKTGVDGKVCVYTYAPTHIVADLNGYFPAPH